MNTRFCKYNSKCRYQHPTEECKSNCDKQSCNRRHHKTFGMEIPEEKKLKFENKHNVQTISTRTSNLDLMKQKGL